MAARRDLDSYGVPGWLQAAPFGLVFAAFFALPLVAFKIVAAVHWQALRLWLKGARLTPRPDAATASPVNIILAAGEPRDYTGSALPAAGSRESALVQ